MFLLIVWVLAWLVPRLLPILGFTTGFLAALDLPGWRSWGALALVGVVAGLSGWLPSSIAVGLAAGLSARAATLTAGPEIDPFWRRSVTVFVFLAPLAMLLIEEDRILRYVSPNVFHRSTPQCDEPDFIGPCWYRRGFVS